jgi:histidine triad (HIT) family protein
MSNCVFCKIGKGEIKSEKIAESDNFFAIFDLHPKSKGHCLIIPKKHFVTILDIPNKLGNELLEFLKKVSSKILDDKYGDGFNVVMNNLECAGQVVQHAHVHIIPRNEKDGLKMLV